MDQGRGAWTSVRRRRAHDESVHVWRLERWLVGPPSAGHDPDLVSDPRVHNLACALEVAVGDGVETSSEDGDAVPGVLAPAGAPRGFGRHRHRCRRRTQTAEEARGCCSMRPPSGVVGQGECRASCAGAGRPQRTTRAMRGKAQE
eukprot:scaffold43876_cov35-Tisochrysis_lutea.AAC.2